MELKVPLTWKNQVERLKKHDLTIEDDKFAEETLKRINYYRLSGYGYQMRCDNNPEKYKTGFSFSQMLQLYEFDRKLRNILLNYLEIIETYYRTQISNAVALKLCKNPPHDQHYNISNYANKDGFSKIMKSIKRETEYRKNSLVVKHHEDKYSGEMPIWVLVEIMSFSNLSKYYKCLKNAEKECIATNCQTSPIYLENHLHCMSVLRNICAHGGRLYNRSLNPPVKLGKVFLRNNPMIDKTTLFAYIYVLINMLPLKEDQETFKTNLFELLEEYEGVLDLSCIGFTENYKTVFKKKLLSLPSKNLLH